MREVVSIISVCLKSHRLIEFAEFIGELLHIMLNLLIGDTCIDLSGLDVGMSKHL